ncbi:3771_t:CDS:10 [Funneliformis geosporum]|uniref:alpha-mannosidase n=1 Tax=Funneliformis geosporum TaxID=1117311 RepID=A0A9W4SB83_9GLOM|nr:3771_t:CDS:10 [Funneliformis geosporum]
MTSPYPRLVRGITFDRCNKFLSRNFYSDVNLYSQLYKKCESSKDYIELRVYSVPNLNRITFEEAIKCEYKKAECGDKFGPSWSTHWFHISVKVPENWKNEEVHFIWDSDSEGMIWTVKGVPLQGLTGGYGSDRRADYILTRCCKGVEKFEFYLEMACNGMFGNGSNTINPPDPNRTFRLTTAELKVPNKDAWGLFYDFQIILDMAKEIPEDTVRSAQALYIANNIINVFRPGDNKSILECRKMAQEFLKNKNGSTQHKLTAVGHCHIDTAWLWPYDETKRKIARSWSTQVGLMDIYPDYKFVCSQAQQFEWLQEHYPKLFDIVKNKVEKGQFLPIGGTWVEMDCNIPSGESFCRQFLYGQRFFEHNFGKKSKVFWLPDTFGYSAQLPQIIRGAGLKYFFTQKLSWNNINKFPNTTFYWVGLDGSKVLTHMCPAESYVSQCTPGELVNSVKNHKDKEYSNESLLVFGNGDGGGGPLASMIERLNRMKDIDGLAKVEMGSAEEFYERIEESSKELVSWKGELYFELHRGTYTTHGSIKRFNRKSELLLRNVELISTINLIKSQTENKESNYNYPKKELDKLWKYVLLNQFHDVLPGSSIEMVYVDATKYYKEVEEKGNLLLENAFDELFQIPKSSESSEKGLLAYNTLGWNRTEVVEVPVCEGVDKLPQVSVDEKTGFILVNDVVGIGAQGIDLGIPTNFSPHGMGREAELGTVKIFETGPLKASLLLESKITATSTLRQVISLSAVSSRIDFDTTVNWDENRQFLATYETQFGFIQRPTHYNTTWDSAKFEVCGHKFADLSEYGYGVALLNDCKYGYAVHGNVMRLSLLRSPKAPDAHCDIGVHNFKYAILPHACSFLESNVVREAYQFNVPLFVRPTSKEIVQTYNTKSYFTISNAPNVILDTVKRAEDSDGIILRLFEAYGGHAKAILTSSLPLDNIYETNILEEHTCFINYNHQDGAVIQFKPFQVITLKMNLRVHWTVQVDTLSSGYVKFSFFVIKVRIVALLTWRRDQDIGVHWG